MPRIRLLASLLLFAGVIAGGLVAQALDCGEIVERALASIPRQCADLERDELCYSHPDVDASFLGSSQNASFGSPSQRWLVSELASVRSGGLELERARWGVAVMNLGANLPLTRAGPGAMVMLAGAAEIINDMDPASALRIGPPLSTATLAETTLYRHPGLLPEPLATVAAEQLLQVDAYDDSGDWLRVVNDGAVAWVASKDVARLKAMTRLPMMGVGAAFPFRALSIATDSAYPACPEAEPMVAIQTPSDASVDLTVNGVDIHIGSMVTFQQSHGKALSLTVHRGKATTVAGQIARQGESVIGILGRGANGDWHALDWSGALPASEAEVARGQRAQAALNSLARVQGWREHQTFRHPPATIHVVARGESLYSIARLYDASVAEIILANQGDDPLRLYAGTKLLIPNPGSGFAGRGTTPLDATGDD